MKHLLLFFFFLPCLLHAQSPAWNDERLNTAAKATYMTKAEREMIYELNRLRSDPPRYAKLYIAKQLEEAKADFEKYGKGGQHYSIQTSYSENKVSKVD